MLTREDDVDAHALHARGWSISAIARHLGHDRKTIRAYVKGGRVAGERVRSSADPFDRFVGYVAERLREDPHLWATTLFDELVELGFDASYQTLTRQIRVRGLRPVCGPSSRCKRRDGSAGRRHRHRPHPARDRARLPLRRGARRLREDRDAPRARQARGDRRLMVGRRFAPPGHDPAPTGFAALRDHRDDLLAE